VKGSDPERPKSLRMAYVPPVPVILPTASLPRRLARRATTVAVMTRRLAPITRRANREPAEVGRRLRLAFEDLGATYVKFGQLIGSSPGAFGQAVSDEFRSCLDTGPTVPYAEVRAAIEAATGAPVDATFADLSRDAVAGASIAVVHRGTLHDGRDVAVKVLRPHIAERVALDLDIMEPLLKHVAMRGVGMAGPMYRFIRGFRTQIAEELDLRNEARTMAHFRELVEDEDLDMLVIPEPIIATEQVLVMEWLDGVAIDDAAAIAEMGHDPGALMQDMLRSWFLTGLRDGMFHGDIHAGNLMLLRDGRAGVIDWGIVGRLEPSTQHVFRRFVEAVLGDPTAWPEIVAFMREMTPLPIEGDDLAQEEKDDIERILTRPFGEVDLTGMFRGPEGRRAKPVTRAEKRARRARIRELRKHMIGSGFAETQLAQSNFLLFKQLLYFERYGKLYLSDVALMGDRDWLQHVLDLSRREMKPTTSGRCSQDGVDATILDQVDLR
jgi:predicted unusual protein kinase regulating ubiquinone biosynthesis (AarF/ABC1/UbiB family)